MPVLHKSKVSLTLQNILEKTLHIKGVSLMRFMFLIGLLVFLAGCKTIPVKQAVELAPRAVNLDDRVRPIAITKVAAKIKRGKKREASKS